MRSRKNITEQFTTFLQLDADKVIGWVTDARLRRSIINAQSALGQPENSEVFWVNHWYKLWQNKPDSLPKNHLLAYLQETCYWSAYNTIKNLSSIQHTVSDCFQMAMTRVDKALKGFKPNMGFNLKNYAGTIFSSELKDMLRQQQEVDICSNWRLLRRLTQKRLVESLQNAGLNPETIQCYVLAWKAYQALYAPQQGTGTRRLQKPDDTTWQAIADFYNSERHTQLSSPGPECSGEVMEKWLAACAKAARDYFYPNFVSLNAPRGNDEDGSEFLDILPEHQQDSLLSEMIIQEEVDERKSQQSQLGDVIIAAIKLMDAEAQKIIELYYSQGLTQQQIAQHLGVKQYTVSRRLTKIKDTLLVKLATWSKESMHIELNSPVLNYIATVLEEWLQAHYSLSTSQLEQKV